jgi:hypothetical protein
VVGIQTAEFDMESLRFRLRSMDNVELLRFGQAATDVEHIRPAEKSIVDYECPIVRHISCGGLEEISIQLRKRSMHRCQAEPCATLPPTET